MTTFAKRCPKCDHFTLPSQFTTYGGIVLCRRCLPSARPGLLARFGNWLRTMAGAAGGLFL